MVQRFKGQERLRWVASIGVALLIGEGEAVSHLISEPWAGLVSGAVLTANVLLTLQRGR